MSRRQQRRLDARAWLCFGGALAHRSGADVGLSAAQRTCAAARQAIGRRDCVSGPRRNRCPQPRLQSLFVGNLAGVGILGEQGRVRSHAQQARARAPSQEIINPDARPCVVRERIMSTAPENLDSYLSGRWQRGEGVETTLVDPVTGDALATVSAKGLDLKSALGFARREGQHGLRGLSYGERAKLVGAVADVLTANRARYEAIAVTNSGNTKTDAAIDIDGGIGTLKYYARLGAGLGEMRTLLDEKPVRLAKAENYQAIHLMVPRRGVAVHINAFNFPSWGLWEKAAVSLLAGVPVLAKPASATALLAHAMVKDVIAAKVLPEGALSVLCGSAAELLGTLTGDDVIAFTGSADTGARVRGHSNVIANSVPVNIEADSINAALLAPDSAPGSVAFDAFVREVVREMTVKAGQKCTAIRRIFVPAGEADAITDALAEKLKGTKVGDPRHADTRMGPVVTRGQQAAAFDGIRRLGSEAAIVCG